MAAPRPKRRPAAEVKARRALRRREALARANETRQMVREALARYEGREVVIRSEVLC